MTTGFEPAPTTLTGWDTGQLCYVTKNLALRYLDSNQEGLINSQLVYLFNGHRTEKYRALSSITDPGARRAFVAEAGVEPAYQGL